VKEPQTSAPTSFFRRPGRRPPSLTQVVGILILILAIGSAAGLWSMVRLYRNSLHATTAQSVLDWGHLMARQLAEQPALRNGVPTGGSEWDDFDRWVQSLRQVEPGLQYVSVAEQGQLIYHRQPELAERTPVRAPDLPVIDRRLIAQGTGVVPVITFTLAVTGDGRPARTLQVALRREVITREESTASAALSALFRMALWTLLGAFGGAVLLIAWAIRRDLRRQEARREEEHLAFAGILADGIFHDVRNPLSSLKLDLQMMEREIGRGAGLRLDRLTELERRSRRTIDRIDVLMEEFLLAAKPDHREPEPLDLNGCVREAVDLVQPHFEKGGLRLDLRLSPEPLMISGFPLALKRAIVNILVNARQAAPEGSTVTVRSDRIPEGASVEIEDDGAGIPLPIRNRVFDWFVSGRPGGTGLGLSLARAAVGKSGGTIQIEDRTPRGTRIRMLIPMRRK
jgi:signal transduction histidine kinase